MSRNLVFVLGRFQCPTVGHAYVIESGQKLARRTNADFVVFPTWTVDTKRNPLGNEEKLKFLKRLFPGVAFNHDVRLRSIIDVFHAIQAFGYKNATMVVGSDRVAEFEKLAKYVPYRGSKPKLATKPPVTEDDEEEKEEETKPVAEPVRKGPRAYRFKVVGVKGTRSSQFVGVQGMSGSKMREYAARGWVEAFERGIPTRDKVLAFEIFTAVRRGMGLPTLDKGPAYLLYGVDQIGRNVLKEAFEVSKVDPKLYRDVSGKSFPEIARLHRLAEQRGYKVTIYTRDARVLTEGVIGTKTTLAALRQAFARDIVDVVTESSSVAISDIVAHIEHQMSGRAVSEADGATKAPSDVDRLKQRQKRDALLFKQRQGTELLQAQQRDQSQKTREAMNRLNRG